MPFGRLQIAQFAVVQPDVRVQVGVAIRDVRFVQQFEAQQEICERFAVKFVMRLDEGKVAVDEGANPQPAWRRRARRAGAARGRVLTGDGM